VAAIHRWACGLCLEEITGDSAEDLAKRRGEHEESHDR
jgi:hypothetical protein